MIGTYTRPLHTLDEHEIIDVCRGCGEPLYFHSKTTTIRGRIHCHKCIPIKQDHDRKIKIAKIIDNIKRELKL